MRKVYVATEGEMWEGYSILGVFESYKSAEALIEKTIFAKGETCVKEQGRPTWWNKDGIFYYQVSELEVKP